MVQPSYEVVMVGLVKRFAKRSYLWEQGYTYLVNSTRLEQPWFTLKEIRKDAKARGVKVPASPRQISWEYYKPQGPVEPIPKGKRKRSS